MFESILSQSIRTLSNDLINFDQRDLVATYQAFQQNQFALNYEGCRTLILSPNHEFISTFFSVINPTGTANFVAQQTYPDILIKKASTYNLVLIDDPQSGSAVIRRIKADNPDTMCIAVGTAQAKEYIEAGALAVIDFDPHNKIKALQQVAEILQRKEELQTFRDCLPGVLLPAERGIDTVEQYLAKLKASKDPYELVFTLGVYDNYAIPVMADYARVETIFENLAELKTEENRIRHDDVLDELSGVTSKYHSFLMQDQNVDPLSFELYPHISVRNYNPITQGFDPLPQDQLGEIRYIKGQSLVQFNTPPADDDYQLKFSDAETTKILLHAQMIVICIENLIKNNIPFCLPCAERPRLYRTDLPLEGYMLKLVYDPAVNQ